MRLNYKHYEALTRRFISRHAPVGMTISSALSIVGVAVMAGPAYEQAKINVRHFQLVENRKTTVFEKVKLGWRPYLPVALTALAGIGTAFGSYYTMARRIGQVSSALSAAQMLLSENDKFREAVESVVGAQGRSDVEDYVADKSVERAPVHDARIPAQKAGGEELVYNALTGGYFYSSVEAINAAVNTFNHYLIHETFGTLNHFYGILGLEPIDIGDDIGWDASRLVEVNIKSRVTPEGVPCLVLDFWNPPTLQYNN